jgi:hypothetical protein
MYSLPHAVTWTWKSDLLSDITSWKKGHLLLLYSFLDHTLPPPPPSPSPQICPSPLVFSAKMYRLVSRAPCPQMLNRPVRYVSREFCRYTFRNLFQRISWYRDKFILLICTILLSITTIRNGLSRCIWELIEFSIRVRLRKETWRKKTNSFLLVQAPSSRPATTMEWQEPIRVTSALQRLHSLFSRS